MIGMLNDVTLCIGCEECVGACQQANGLGPDLPWRWRLGDGLSEDRWCSIVRLPGRHNVRKLCRHCLDPACVSACPVAALHRTEDGAVIYDSARCMGCRYCMMACPYGIPRYSWQERIPLVRKCILCHDRVSRGDQPACVAACPTQATVFGEREELIARARGLLRENPDRYLQTIWGEHEAGGTAVLYVSDVDLSWLGLRPDLGDEPLPETTQPAMAAIPGVFVGVGLTLAGLRWIIDRRQRLAETQAATSNNGEDER